MASAGYRIVEPRRASVFAGEQLLGAAAFVTVAVLALGPEARARPGAIVGLVAIGAAALLVLHLGYSIADLRDLRVAEEDSTSGRRLMRVIGAALGVTGAGAILLPRQEAAAALAGASAAGVALLSFRAALPAVTRRFSLRTRLFLVGDGYTAHRLAREVAKDAHVEVVGFCGPRAGGVADKVRASGAEMVVVATDERRGVATDDLLQCRAKGVPVLHAAEFAGRVLQRLPVDLLRPGDLVYGDGFTASLASRIGARALSMLASLTLLVLTLPLLLGAAIAIRLDSNGPIFFRQRRVGRDGGLFEMLKLRTMTIDAEQQAGATWAAKEDPRVTRVGRVLRRFRVDELPQLVNVLRGEMDLVGPRPERPEFVSMLRERIPYYDLRHLVAPGITGWAQVCYPYAASVEEAREKLQYDLYYVRHRSVSFDALVLMMTVRTILAGRGAR